MVALFSFPLVIFQKQERCFFIPNNTVRLVANELFCGKAFFRSFSSKNLTFLTKSIKIKEIMASQDKKQNAPHANCAARHSVGAEDGTRTHDLLITNQLLYQLSHFSVYGLL